MKTRVYNSKSVQLPSGFYTCHQSAVNVLRCENTAVKRCGFATVHIANVHLERIYIKYLLSIFTTDCLHTPIQMVGVETGSCTLGEED